MNAACCNRSVRFRHLNDRNAVGTQGHGIIRWKLYANTQVVSHFCNFVRTDCLYDLHKSGVRRHGKSLRETQRSVALITKVLNTPGRRCLHRRIAVDARLGAHALVDGCGERVGLKGRTWLAVCLRSKIELVGCIILAAYHCFDIAGLGIDRTKCRFKTLVAERIEAFIGCVLGFVLDLRIESGIYLEPSLHNGIAIKIGQKQLFNIVGEIGVAAFCFEEATRIDSKRLS